MSGPVKLFLVMKKIFVLILVLAIGVAGWFCQSNFFAIDSCLDQGGCWRYQTKQCEFVEQKKCDEERPADL
jgi:hypothetical protein